MWNAEIYNRYGKERIQPSIDLVARVREMKFQRILDCRVWYRNEYRTACFDMGKC